MINTVVRQIAFYTFERRVHEARRAGELTSEQLGEIWMDVQRQSLGPAIDLKTGYENFWGLHSSLHPLAVLCVRIRVRRLLGKLALRPL